MSGGYFQSPAMGSKDSALLPFDSRFPSSAPHTGQARFRASGAPNPAGSVPIFAFYSPFVLAAYCCPSGFRVPGMSRPLRPVSGFPGRPGWSSRHRLLRVRCPCCIIGDLSAYPVLGDVSGSGVARTVRSSSALGALQIPLSLASQAGKRDLADE